MRNSPLDRRAEDSPSYLAAKNVAIITMSIGMMAVILGAFAVAIQSLWLWLSIFAVVEAAGVMVMSSRLPRHSGNIKAEYQVRTARGLAMLAIALVIVAAVFAAL